MGKGVCIAVLDTGISDHPDLEGLTVGFRDFVGNSIKYNDDSGHGTHVAGILSGNGRVSNGFVCGNGSGSVTSCGKVCWTVRETAMWRMSWQVSGGSWNKRTGMEYGS